MIRSKKIFATIITTILFSSGLESALPPVYQSIREYKALIESPELSQQLGSGEAITDIQRQGEGFVITTPRKTLKVDVVFDPQEMPGPTKFHLVFHTPSQKE